jgi:hypothetical protein
MKSAGPIWKTSIPDELYEKNKPIPFKVFFFFQSGICRYKYYVLETGSKNIQ